MPLGLPGWSYVLSRLLGLCPCAPSLLNTKGHRPRLPLQAVMIDSTPLPRLRAAPMPGATTDSRKAERHHPCKSWRRSRTRACSYYQDTRSAKPVGE